MAAAPGMISYLFIDTNTADLLVAQPECESGKRNVQLKGYEAYMIEQWACERRPNTVVASYTGNSADVVVANIVDLPKDSGVFGPVTVQVFDGLHTMHLLPKETDYGRMLVTNLSSFPSSWTLIPMPAAASFAKVRRLFVENENLRRLHCIGRQAISLDPAGHTASEKFRSMYKVPAHVPIDYAARELVTLMQIALFYAGVLEPQYVDGLLCDYTVRATSEWWTQFGTPRYHQSPVATDRQYFVTTVAALVGWVMGCRSRLSVLNFKPPKDPFDADRFVACIRQFQKSERLTKTMRLDEQTTKRLLEATKSAGNQMDLFSVVKSSLKEGLSGKTQTSIEDSETVLLGLLVPHVRGRRARYLWHGVGHRPSTASETADVADIEGKVCSVTGIPLSSLNLEDRERERGSKSGRPSLVDRLRARARGEERSFDKRKGSVQASSVSLPESHDGASRLSHTANSSIDGSHLAPSRAVSPGCNEPKTDKVTPNRPLLTDVQALTRDDNYIEKTPRQNLKRVASLSQVERVVLPYDLPASSPRVYMLYEQAQALRKELMQHLGNESQLCEKLGKELQRQNSQVNSENRKTDHIKFQVHASRRKEYTVKMRIRDLEALMSKLDYEWRILDAKVTEIEHSVDRFGEKVDTVESRWNKISQSSPSWWKTLFGS